LLGLLIICRKFEFFDFPR